MSPPKITKKFDCLQFKAKAQERIYQDIRAMTHAEEIRYFQEAAEKGPLARWWKQVLKA